MYSRQADAYGVKILFSNKTKDDPIIYTDKLRVQQILLNLIENGVKRSLRG